MPRYEVVLTAGLDFPVGFEFESDNLHPSMLQHVKQVGGKAKVAPVESVDEVKELTKAQLDKLHAEALKEDAARSKPAPTPSAGKPADGPGENS